MLGRLARLEVTLFVSVFALVSSAPARAASDAVGWRPDVRFEDDKLRIEWGEYAQLALGGLVQGDWGYIQNDVFATPSGWDAELRRGRIELDGLFFNHLLLRFEYDFSGTPGRAVEPDIDYKDVYIGVRGLGPLGTLRLGYMKEPYSLQHLVDAADRIFLEEALSTVFTPGRNTGIALNHHLFDQRMTWAIGGFSHVTDESDFFGNGDEWDLALRTTGLPIYREEGRKLLHIGVAGVFTWRDDDDLLRYRQRPEANLADPLPVAGPFASSGEYLVGVEIAGNYGPFHGQFEASISWQRRPDTSPTHTKSAYIQLGVFLTGEHRPYETATGIFDRVRPEHPIAYRDGRLRGWGAWQLAFRTSYLDLNTNHPGEPRSDRFGEFGVALNWYLTSNLRLASNYLYLTNDGGSSLFQMRVQLNF